MSRERDTIIGFVDSVEVISLVESTVETSGLGSQLSLRWNLLSGTLFPNFHTLILKKDVYVLSGRYILLYNLAE